MYRTAVAHLEILAIFVSLKAWFGIALLSPETLQGHECSLGGTLLLL